MKENILNHFNEHWQDFYGKYLPSLKQLGGNEYQALCPFHEDKNPSLNINSEKGQYYCHGCNKKGDAFHFFGKVNGLRTGADFGKILRGIAKDHGIPWEEKKRKLVKTYDYTDPEGKLLYQVCRMEPKDFRQRQPNGNGGWAWNLKGVELVPYNLPEVVKSEIVAVVEGEKDVEALRTLEIVGTCNPMGAGKWKPEYTECLKGKHVVLMPDNDNQGREHMAKVGASLNGHAASIRLIELPGLSSKGDVSDFVAQMGDDKARDELWNLIDSAPEYKPPKTKTHEDVILKVSDFLKIDLPKRRVFLNPWLQEQSITLISGWRGVGKSWFAIDLLRSVSKGEPFGPWEAGEPVPTLYLDGEMIPQDVVGRLSQLDAGLSEDIPFYVYSDALANTYGLSRANLLSEKWRSIMGRILLTRGIKLWVVDNIVSTTPGIDENSQREWSPVNEWLLNLRFQGIGTILLHHTGKGGTQRGTSGREDNIDTSIILKRPHDYTSEDGARFICHFAKARVSISDLTATADSEFRLTADTNNERLSWTWGNVKRERKREILRMLDEGQDYNSIKDDLGLSSKGYITKVKNQAVKDKLLSKDGKLTYSGHEFLRGE